MRIDMKHGRTTVALVKAETRAICESRYIINSIAQATGSDALKETAESLKRVVTTFGNKYVDEEGNLILSEEEKARLGL